MSSLLKRSGIEFSEDQMALLLSYHRLLRRFNPELNLTRIHNFTNMVLKLYVDSILPGQLIDLPSPLLDLGTGPGMPGIPLKIAFPHLNVILAETRKNRADFLNLAVQQLNLKETRVIAHSITERFETPVAGVITRAVEQIPDTLQRVSGCVSEGGQVIFMKGPHCEDEIADAANRFSGQFLLEKDIAYRIPHTSHDRRLVVFKRLVPSGAEKKSSAMKKYTFHEIESEQNPIFKTLKKLLTGRGIKKHQMAIVAGTKPIHEILIRFPDLCDAWISPDTRQMPPEGAPGHLKWYALAPGLFKALDTFDTGAPLLLVRTPPIKPWQCEKGLLPGCSLLVPFQDPENVGTVIRSAVAFGVDQVILLAESAHPYHPKTIRASGGNLFHADLYQGPSISELPESLAILPLSGEGEDISRIDFPDTFAFLPGLEGPGLPAHLRPKAISIPIAEAVESLNASAATAIALYLWSQSHRKPGKGNTGS